MKTKNMKTRSSKMRALINNGTVKWYSEFAATMVQLQQAEQQNITSNCESIIKINNDVNNDVNKEVTWSDEVKFEKTDSKQFRLTYDEDRYNGYLYSYFFSNDAKDVTIDDVFICDDGVYTYKGNSIGVNYGEIEPSEKLNNTTYDIKLPLRIIIFFRFDCDTVVCACPNNKCLAGYFYADVDSDGIVTLS